MTNRERERRAMDLFLEICDLPPDDVRRRVDETRMGDPSLAERLEALLQGDAANADLSAPIRRLAADAVRENEATDPSAIDVPGHSVLEELGRGGAAVVYRARHERLGRDVALKVLHAERWLEGTAADRFHAESEAVARLQHPNIVQVFEVGSAGGRPYIAFELVSGGTLARRIAGASQSPRHAAELVEQLARAIHCAHEHGIVHRDLKPSNVLLTESGTPKIADFGLAKQTDRDLDRTATGTILGTPGYMAPEQVSGTGEVGPAADVHALGVILYEMLAGHPPFHAETTMGTLERILNEDPPGLRSRGVPRELETVCLKTLAKEPSRRYRSAADLAEDLRRFLDHRPVSARRPGPVDRLRLWCRRRPALALTLASSALIVATVIAVSFERVAAERDAARAALYRSQVSEARARIRAGGAGWQAAVMERIAAASTADSPHRDASELRALLSDCLAAEAPHFQQVAELEVGRVRSAAGGGDVLAVATAAGALDVYRVHEGRLVNVGRSLVDGVVRVALDRAGTSLVTGGSGGELRWLELDTTGDELSFEERDVPVVTGARITALATSSDGTAFAAGDETGGTWLFALGDRGAIRARSIDERDGAVTALAFSSSGERLVIGCREPSIRLHDLATGELIAHVHVFEPPDVLHFEEDESRLLLASGADHGVGSIVLDGVPGKGYVQHAHAGSVTFLQRDDRGRAVSASRDGTLVMWENVRVARRRTDAAAGTAIGAAAFVGRHLVTLHDDGLARSWEVVEPRHKSLVQRSHDLAFIDDGNRLALTGAVVDLRRGSRHAEYTPSAVRALAPHPHAARLAVGRRDGFVEVLATASADVEHRWLAHEGGVTALAASPDGRHLASVGADGTLRTWDWSGSPAGTGLATQLGSVKRLAWIGRDRMVALGPSRTELLAVEGGSASRRVTWQEPATDVAVIGERVFLGAHDGHVTEIAGDTGEVIHRRRASDHAVAALASLEEPRWLVAVDIEGRVVGWRLGKPGEPSRWRLDAGVRWALLTPDARFLLTGDGVGVTAWPLDDAGASFSLALAGGKQTVATMSPDGLELHVGTEGGAVRRVPLSLLDVSSTAAARTSGRHRISHFDTLVPGGHLDMVWGLAASADGRWVATAAHDHAVKLWRAPSMTLAANLDGHEDVAWSVAFSPDSRRIASGSAAEVDGEPAGEIRLWDVASRQLVGVTRGHDRLVSALAFEPSGERLFSASLDGDVRAWTAATLAPDTLVHGFETPIASLSFRPDGAWLAAVGDGGTVALWEVARLQGPAPPHRVLHAGDQRLWAVEFSPTGRWLAVASEAGAITLFDGETFARGLTLTESRSVLRSLAFDPAERRLAAGGYVRPSVVWDLAQVEATLDRLGLAASD